MSVCIYNMDLNSIIKILQEEFNRVDLNLEKTNIEMMEMAGWMSFTSPLKRPTYKLIIKFECSEDEFKYIRPFVRYMKYTQVPVENHAIFDKRKFWNHDTATVYETYVVCECTIELQIDGDNFMDFIHSFRKELQPLYEAAESRKFDEEVERMLKEDEYNN